MPDTQNYQPDTSIRVSSSHYTELLRRVDGMSAIIARLQAKLNDAARDLRTLADLASGSGFTLDERECSRGLGTSVAPREFADRPISAPRHTHDASPEKNNTFNRTLSLHQSGSEHDSGTAGSYRHGETDFDLSSLDGRRSIIQGAPVLGVLDHRRGEKRRPPTDFSQQSRYPAKNAPLLPRSIESNAGAGVNGSRNTDAEVVEGSVNSSNSSNSANPQLDQLLPWSPHSDKASFQGAGRPSPYCRHILEAEGRVRRALIKQYHSPASKKQSIDSLVCNMLKTLTSQYWPWVRFFYEVTSSYDRLGPIVRWQIEPTAENYHKLSKVYQPTEVQMLNPHWPIIDWLPYPSLRDKLILHSNSYDLPKVSNELWKHFALEAEEEDDDNGDEEVEVEDFGVRMDLDLVGGHMDQFGSRRHSCRPKRKVFYRLREYLEFLRQKPSVQLAERTMRQHLAARFLLALQETGDERPLKIDPSFYKIFPSLYSKDDVAQGIPQSIFKVTPQWQPANQLSP